MVTKRFNNDKLNRSNNNNDNDNHENNNDEKDFLVITQGFFGEVVDGQLNPFLLAVATAGYLIQSRILRIPYQWGPFSPGPPRLQVRQALFFNVAVLCNCLNTILYVLLLPLLIFAGNDLWDVGKQLSFIIAVGSFAFWVFMVFCESRKPGYKFKDWEPRKDEVQ